METYNFKSKSSLEFRIPHNLRMNSLANANIFGFVLYAALLTVAMLVEVTTYKLVLLEVMQLPEEEATKASYLVLLFSKLIAIVLYRPYLAWLKSSSKWFYKVVIRTLGITVAVNIIIFGVLFSYQNMLEQAIEAEQRTNGEIQQTQQLLSDSEEDTGLTTTLEKDVKDLELKKERYSYRVVSIEDSRFIRALKILFNVLLSFNSVMISAILFLWTYFYFLSLMYKFKIKRLRKRLDIVRSNFSTRLYHLKVSNAKMKELHAEILNLINKSK